jgi:predicted DNA-binding transcriptional regulator AlpA
MLLTIEQVAERISYSPHTLRRWTYAKLSGWPQPRRTGPRREWRWPVAAIDQWIERQPQRPTRTTQVRRARP